MQVEILPQANVGPFPNVLVGFVDQNTILITALLECLITGINSWKRLFKVGNRVRSTVQIGKWRTKPQTLLTKLMLVSIRYMQL